MTDWGMYELEEIVWDKFGESDDHIVPHPGSEQVDECGIEFDFLKKRRSAVADVVTKNKSVVKDAIQEKETSFTTLNNEKAPMLEKGSWSRTPDTGSVKEESSLAFNNISNNCFNNSNIDSIDNEFSTDYPILGNRVAAIGGNLCRFPLGDISTTDSDLEFFGNEHGNKENNDLLYYGWPDIGNFEDVDRLFRSCDFTFGQGNATNDDELSWFSSISYAMEGSEDALKSDCKYSCSKSSALKSTSKYHEADMKSMPGTVTPSINDSDMKNVPSTYRKNSWSLDTGEPATGHHSCANCLDANIGKKGESSSNEHVNKKQRGLHDGMIQKYGINEGIQIKISPITQINDETSAMRKQFKNRISSEGQRGGQSLEYLSSSFHGSGTLQQSANVKLPSSLSSTPQVFPSLDIPQQNQNSVPDSISGLHTYISYPHSEYTHYPHYNSVAQPTSNIKSKSKSHPSLILEASYASKYAQPLESTLDPSPKAPAMIPEEKIEELCRQQQVQATFAVDPQHEDLLVLAPFTEQILVQNQMYQIQDEVGGNSEVDGVSMEFPAEVDSSTVQESSCVTSMSDEILLEATSFRQFQHNMEQLDIRTKLCLRDSLYRLARSAEQRHKFGSSNAGSRDARDKCGVVKTEESNRFTGFMDMETDTNSIDRSIAHLLFHRPIDPSTKAVNDALLFESRSIIHGSIINQPVMPEKLVCEEVSADGADTMLQITD